MEQSFYNLVEASVPSGVSVAWGHDDRNAGNPKVIIWRVGRSDQRLIDRPRGHVEQLLQLDVWADTWLEAYDLSEIIRLALDGAKSGRIHGIWLQSVRDNEPTPDLADRESRIQLDFLTQFTEAAS